MQRVGTSGRRRYRRARAYGWQAMRRLSTVARRWTAVRIVGNAGRYSAARKRIVRTNEPRAPDASLERIAEIHRDFTDALAVVRRIDQ